MKLVRKLAFQLFLLAAAFLLLAGADFLTGRFVPELKLARQLFPPRSEITMNTPEFAFTARINWQGFRDREFGTPSTDRIRALAIGDSFTFGWGVPIEGTWVKRLERGLETRGKAIEIANLGKPGTGPIEYAAVATIAAPLLHPNLVLVALQQTDDLQQAVPDPVFLGLLKGLERETVVTRVKSFWQQAFPNFLLLFSGKRVESAGWGFAVARILEIFSDSERDRFQRLDPEVRRMFLNGQLNPGLLAVATKVPGYFVEPADLTSQRMRERIDALASQLQTIKQAATKVNAQAVVLSVPNRAYVSAADIANVRRLGFETRPGFADWSVPDDVFRDVAARVGVRVITVTDAFRQACRVERCYYQFDDHFNDAGHRIFAELLTNPLAELLRQPKEPR